MPAKKPSGLKRLQGTYRMDRANHYEPMPLRGTLPCPAWLDDVAGHYWDTISAQVHGMYVLTELDGHALALLCSAMAEYRAAPAVILTDGPTYECLTKSGDRMRRQRPEVAIAQDAWRRAKMMLEQFGLTPATRPRVEAAPEVTHQPCLSCAPWRGPGVDFGRRCPIWPCASPTSWNRGGLLRGSLTIGGRAIARKTRTIEPPSPKAATHCAGL